MGAVKVVLTDFERTLVRLFEDNEVEREFSKEVRALCAKRGVPKRVLKAAGTSPYSLWTRAHRWTTKHEDPLAAERMYHAVTRIAIKYEMCAAPSIKLFEDVKPVLEQWKAAGITVMIVSNNDTMAVQRVLRENDAALLVDQVIGRDFDHELLGNLKPRPLLLEKALELSGCKPGTALLVGDSVDDMRAGKAAEIGFRVGLLQHSTVTKWQLRRAGAKLVLNRFGDLQDHPDLRRRLFGTDVSGVR